RNSAASAPVTRSFPRPELSTTPAASRVSSYSAASITSTSVAPVYGSAMGLRADFERVVSTLPPDWSRIDLDLRIFDEERYVEAATLLTQINAQPYSQHDWHWRLSVAREFGHAAAPETVEGTLGVLDEQGIEGELPARGARRPRGGDADVGTSRIRAPGVPPPPRAVMKRVALLCPDLLLGSKLEEAMRAAGHDVTRYDGEDMARAAVAEGDVLVVDLDAE